ncbi:MAG: tetratricopeptide repeat protein [bacterium]
MKKEILIGLIILSILNVVHGSGAKDMIKMGDKYAQKGDYESAMKAYNEALVLDPKDAEAAYKIGWAHNRMALNSTGETKTYHFNEASNILARAIELDNKNPLAHIELARSLLFSGLAKDNWDSYTLALRIKEELDIASKLDNKQPDLYFLLGLWHRYVSKKPYLWRRPLGLGEASKESELYNLNKAFELAPNRIDILFELGKTILSKGDTLSSKKAFQKIESLEPIDPYERMLKNEANSIMSKLQR